MNKVKVRAHEDKMIELAKSFGNDEEVNGLILAKIEQEAFLVADHLSIEGNRRAKILWAIEAFVPNLPFAYPEEIEDAGDDEDLYEKEYAGLDDDDYDIPRDDDGYYSF